MKTVAFCNIKVGVAKTTSSLALATGLADRGYKVLAIDSDPQSNLAQTFGVDLYNIPAITLYTVFNEKRSINESIINVRENLDVILGGIELAQADLAFSGFSPRELMFANAMKDLEKEYDYCIVDCCTYLGLVNTNILAFANEVIIPMEPGAYATYGANLLLNFIVTTSQNFNPDLDVNGILITKLRNTRNADTWIDAIENLGKEYDINIYNSKIRLTVSIEESQTLQESMFEYAPSATGVKDYSDFVDEFLKGENK